ncbi:hypothetical protein ES703_60009 [subsurface metagenome]
MIETLRPIANGTFQEHNYQVPAEGEHYDKVDEVVADDAETYIGARHTYDALTDTFVIPPHQQGSGIINSVTVYGRFRNGAAQNGYQSVVVFTHGEVYSYEWYWLPVAWTTQSYSWSVNPYTGEPWTWEEIDNLEIGVIDKYHGTYCTQVYVEVDYTLRAAYHLDVTINGEGLVLPEGVSGDYWEGSVIELTAAPAPGWLFHSWEGTDNDAANPTTVTMDSDKHVVCNFTQVAPAGCLPVVAAAAVLVAGIIAGIIALV